MTLLGGAIFGLVTGTIVVSFASSVGATLAFLASRYLLRDWVQQRFGGYPQALNAGVEKGGFYLFTLRLIPAVPFFLLNLAMGLTPMRTPGPTVSQAGMLAGTIVYVNAGATGGHRLTARHPLARTDRRLRAARPVPADRQEGDGRGARGVSTRPGATAVRAASTATWW